MNYDHYDVFRVVAKHKNFTRAAKELFTSQPSVSRTIQNIENDLGCRLFIRGKKGVEFTPEGKILYGYVESAFQQLKKGEEQISNRLSLEGGTISLGATVTALDEFLFDFLNEFHKSYPKVRFEIASQSSNGTLEKLRNAQIDIAFVTTPYKEYDDLKATEIGSFENVVIAGNGLSKLSKGSHDLKDIANYPLVFLPQHMQLRQYTNALFEDLGIEVAPTLEVDSASTVIPMVHNNLGIGIVPYSLAKLAIERKEVFIVKLNKPLPKRKVVMLTSNSFSLSIVAEKFAIMAKEKAKNNG